MKRDIRDVILLVEKLKFCFEGSVFNYFPMLVAFALYLHVEGILFSVARNVNEDVEFGNATDSHTQLCFRTSDLCYTMFCETSYSRLRSNVSRIKTSP